MNMELIKLLFSICWCCFLSTVLGKIEIEFELQSFSNPNSKLKSGECCQGVEVSSGRCALPCRTFFTACVYEKNSHGNEGNPDPTFSCDNSHYTNLRSNVIGDGTFGSISQITDPSKRNTFIIKSTSVENFKAGVQLILDIEAWNEGDRQENKNSGLIAEFRVSFEKVFLNQWTETVKSSIVHSGGPVKLEMRARVSCAPNYYGENCSKPCFDRETKTCNEEGELICSPGYGGKDCKEVVCDEGCSGNGVCVGPNECFCYYGFTGKTCSQCVPLEGCKHGQCENNRPHTCSCDVGWGGTLCDKDLEFCTRKKPCQNGGTCIPPINSVIGHRCNCLEGFTGRNCEERIGVVDLATNCNQHALSMSLGNEFCQNGGVCQDGKCRCTLGWGGPKCDEELSCDDGIKQRACQNGGRCSSTTTINKPHCLCAQGYVGKFCEIKNPCGEDGEHSACQNGGNCTSYSDGSYKCACSLKFSGTHCEKALNSSCHENNPCRNGGTCRKFENSTKCDCLKGFTGEFCADEQNPCARQPCLNGAQCVRIDSTQIEYQLKRLSEEISSYDEEDKFECKCKEGFYGKLCSQRLPIDPKVDLTTTEKSSKDDDSEVNLDVKLSASLHIMSSQSDQSQSAPLSASSLQFSPLHILLYSVAVVIVVTLLLMIYFLFKKLYSASKVKYNNNQPCYRATPEINYGEEPTMTLPPPYQSQPANHLNSPTLPNFVQNNVDQFSNKRINEMVKRQEFNSSIIAKHSNPFYNEIAPHSVDLTGQQLQQKHRNPGCVNSYPTNYSHNSELILDPFSNSTKFNQHYRRNKVENSSKANSQSAATSVANRNRNSAFTEKWLRISNDEYELTPSTDHGANKDVQTRLEEFKKQSLKLSPQSNRLMPMKDTTNEPKRDNNDDECVIHNFIEPVANHVIVSIESPTRTPLTRIERTRLSNSLDSVVRINDLNKFKSAIV